MPRLQNKLSFTYQPQQGMLAYLVNNHPASWIGYGGSRGGGKSGAARRLMVERRIKYPKTSGQILRRVWDDVKKNHVDKMWDDFPELHQYYRAEPHCIEMPEKLGGGKIFFDSAENKTDVERKAFGPEFFDIIVDQAEQFTEDELVQLKTTCRWPGTPLSTCKFILPFNPGGVGAGFLQRIFYLKEYHGRETPTDYVFLQAYGWDNIEWARAPLSEDGLPTDCRGKKCGKCCVCVYYSWPSDKRFEYYINRTQYGREQNALPAHMRAGQLLGDFKKFAGQYFSNFDEGQHVWNREEIDFQPYWLTWGSLDWGYSHSSSFHWHTQAGYVDETGAPKRLVITFRELVRDHISERALAEEIVARNNGLPLASIYAGHDLWAKNSHGDTKESAMSAVFRHHGLPSIKKAKIDRVDGWRFLHRSLDEMEWIITRDCPEAIRAIPSAIYNTKDAGKEEDILKTNHKWDDVLDDLRYGLYSQYGVEDEPEMTKIQRKLKGITDPTQLNILMMKAQADRNRELATQGWANVHGQGRYRRYAA